MKALIMAGGAGTRFWPKSREKRPKQLLKIYGDKTMLQSTVDRLTPIVPTESMFIISTESQKDEIKRQLPSLPARNLIIEPRGRNTAPAIGFAALCLERIDPEGVTVVLPSDHLITDDDLFIKTLKVAERVADEREQLVTIGIEPTYASTGYGYIQCNEKVENIDDVSFLSAIQTERKLSITRLHVFRPFAVLVPLLD